MIPIAVIASVLIAIRADQYLAFKPAAAKLCTDSRAKTAAADPIPAPATYLDATNGIWYVSCWVDSQLTNITPAQVSAATNAAPVAKDAAIRIISGNVTPADLGLRVPDADADAEHAWGVEFRGEPE